MPVVLPGAGCRRLARPAVSRQWWCGEAGAEEPAPMACPITAQKAAAGSNGIVPPEGPYCPVGPAPGLLKAAEGCRGTGDIPRDVRPGSPVESQNSSAGAERYWGTLAATGWRRKAHSRMYPIRTAGAVWAQERGRKGAASCRVREHRLESPAMATGTLPSIPRQTPRP